MDATRKDEKKASWKEIYSNPENLVEIKFSNKTDSVKYVWVEPAALSLELLPKTEYRILTHETRFSIEYDDDNQFTLWMDYSCGFLLYKKQSEDASSDWILDIDLSEVQFNLIGGNSAG